jgi:predicted short-subunit dehydrogenase-like oxidoreductase (DUF2520 family)
MSTNKKIGIIGVGKVGTAVGVLLKQAGYEIGFIADIDPERVKAAQRELGGVTGEKEGAARSKEVDILFITTPDRLINDVAAEISRKGGIRAGQIVVHMSGSLTSDILEPVRKYGAFAASLHPLQSFADFHQAKKNIPGSVFCLEGDEPALAELKKMIGIFGGEQLSIPKQQKVLYHAGAVVASNYLVTLLWASVLILKEIGMKEKTALRALLPLVEGTLNNVKALGVPAALTGPIARGDAPTISEHVDALKEKIPELLDFYRVMGKLTVEAARHNKSAPEELLEKIKTILADTEDR